MSLERGQAGTEAAEAGNGAGCWEATARRRARPRQLLCPSPRHHSASSQPGWGGSQRYPLITDTTYTIINEHAAVVVSVTAAGGFGDGEKSKLCKIHVVRPGHPQGQSSVCLRLLRCRVFLISPFSKEKSGSCRDSNLALRGFFPLSSQFLPQSSPRRESWPLAGLPVCLLAVETPVSGSAPNPFSFDPAQ